MFFILKYLIKVAIYEDNEALRQTLSHLVKGSGSMELTGAFRDANSIVAHCRTASPEIILMDIDMPGINGIEATAQVKSSFPEIQILIFTVFSDREKVFDALCAGATGYLLKKSSAIQIIEAVNELYKGGSPMTGEIARMVMQYFSGHTGSLPNEYELSPRELEILSCLVEGDSYKMIADACCISIGTVCSHINSIYRKLHVNSKSEAVIKAMKERLVR